MQTGANVEQRREPRMSVTADLHSEITTASVGDLFGNSNHSNHSLYYQVQEGCKRTWP